jgi:transposase
MIWQRGRAYAQDVRERVFAASDAGMSVGRIAERLFVSISYVSKALGRRRAGETMARPQRCHIPRKLTGQFAAIRQQVEMRPDATIEELCAWLRETHQVTASTTLMWETLGHLDLTPKKRPCTPRSKIARTWRRPAPSGARTSPP